MEVKETVDFKTENDQFDYYFNRAMISRKLKNGEPYQQVKALFEEKNLVHEEDSTT